MNYTLVSSTNMHFSKTYAFTYTEHTFLFWFFKNLSFYNELYTVRLGAILGPFWLREGSMSEPSRAGPGRAEPSRAEPGRADPSRAGPGRAEPEPSRYEPKRTEPIRAGPGPIGAWFGDCVGPGSGIKRNNNNNIIRSISWYIASCDLGPHLNLELFVPVWTCLKRIGDFREN